MRRPAASSILLLATSLAIGGCAHRQAASVEEASRSPLAFRYYTAAGESISAASLRGRTTAVLFVTTYDSASQLVAQELQGIVRRYAPRINALVVVLEPPQSVALLPVYSDSLGLTIPVTIADYATQSGEGSFGKVARVPTLVLLDKEGVERWRGEGAKSGGAIERRLRAVTGELR